MTFSLFLTTLSKTKKMHTKYSKLDKFIQYTKKSNGLLSRTNTST